MRSINTLVLGISVCLCAWGEKPVVGVVGNAASLAGRGTVAPGSIVTIFGSFLGTEDRASTFPATKVNGLSAFFGETPAPIFDVAASFGYLNVLVPPGLSPGGTVSLVLRHDQNGDSEPVMLRVAAAVPGIYSLSDPSNSSRRNAIAMVLNTAWIAMPTAMAMAMHIPQNCDALDPSMLCGRPVHPGDSLTIYATGLGRATPSRDATGEVLPAGELAPKGVGPMYQTVDMPTVMIGGLPATVLFSGLVPGAAGLYQINVVIPAAVEASGDNVSLTVTMPGSITDSALIAVTPL